MAAHSPGGRRFGRHHGISDGFFDQYQQGRSVCGYDEIQPLSGGRDEFQSEVRNSPQRGAHARRQTTRQAGARGGHGT
jgi:hypothetical protein